MTRTQVSGLWTLPLALVGTVAVLAGTALSMRGQHGAAAVADAVAAVALWRVSRTK